jgi:hypothetical protein
LSQFLHLTVLKEHTPKSIHLILDTLRMLHDLEWVLEIRLLLGCILVVSAVVVRDLDEPDGGADEDVEGFGVRLHCRDGLNRGGAGANHSDLVVLPLLLLVVFGPAGCVYDLRISMPRIHKRMG